MGFNWIKNNHNDLPFQRSVDKVYLIGMILLECVFLYLFPVKNMLIIGLFGFIGLFAALSIFIYPYLGVLLMITLVFSNLASWAAAGAFKILVFYCLGAWLIKTILEGRSFIKAESNRYLWLFFLVSIVSVIFSRDQILGVEALVIFLKSAIIYFLIINALESFTHLKLAFWLIVISATMNAVLVISNTLLDASLVQRATGLKEDPNNLAMVLVASIPFIVPLLKEQKSWIVKLILSGCLISILGAVALTYSRGGIIALGVVMLLLLFYERKNKILITFVLIILAVVVYLFITQFGEYENLLRLVSQERSFIQRLKLYQGGIKMFSENWFLGVGLGNFIVWSKYYSNLVIKLYAHNAFLHVGAETGVFGLFCYGMFILTAILKVRKTIQKNVKTNQREVVEYGHAILISLAGFVVSAMFLSQHFNKILFILIGLAVVFERACSSESSAVE